MVFLSPTVIRKKKMASDPLSVKGVILESREFKEKDRMITILSGEHGILDFIAKGTSKVLANV